MSNNMDKLNKTMFESLSKEVVHATEQKELYYSLCGVLDFVKNLHKKFPELGYVTDKDFSTLIHYCSEAGNTWYEREQEYRNRRDLCVPEDQHAT